MSEPRITLQWSFPNPCPVLDTWLAVAEAALNQSEVLAEIRDANLVSFNVFGHIEFTEPPHNLNATTRIHWATGPVDCCEKHALALGKIAAVLGTHVHAEKLDEPAECTNCANEAAAEAK